MISVGGLAVEYLACRARCRGYRAGNKDEITNLPGFCTRCNWRTFKVFFILIRTRV